MAAIEAHVRASTPTVMVLEEFQYAPDGVVKLLTMVVKRGIRNLFFVPITTCAFPLDDELLLKGLVNRITVETLALSRQEVVRKFSLGQIELTEQEADFAYDYSEGWLAAVQFLMMCRCSNPCISLVRPDDYDEPFLRAFEQIALERMPRPSWALLCYLSDRADFTLEEADFFLAFDAQTEESTRNSFGRGLTVTMARPIIVNGAFNGVLGADLLIESINEEILSTQFGSGGYAMLFSKNGSAISARGLSEENHAPEAFLGIRAKAVLEAMRASETGAVRSEIGGEPVYILFAPVATTQWKLTVVMPVGEILAPATSSNAAIDLIIREARADMGNIIGNLNLIMIGAFAALAAAFIVIVWGACGRISQPVLKLSEDVRRIGEGKLEYHTDIHTGDEIELLSQSFERMTASLRVYIENLTRVTAEKERIGAELGVATRIQASMLPCIFPPFPDRPEFDIYAAMTPAKEVGGDFYDFFMVDDDHLAVVIADVSGKGIPAALFMMTAKTLIKTLAQTGLGPAQVFTEANARLSQNSDAGMFVTAWMGVLEISTGRFVYVNAGHNPPLIRRAGEDFQFLKSRAAFVLAGMEGIRYRQEEALFSPGDLLYIYTDGVTEATDPEDRLYGDERLQRVLNAQKTQNLAAILRAVKQDVDAFAAGAPQFDDITMLALRFDKRGE